MAVLKRSPWFHGLRIGLLGMSLVLGQDEPLPANDPDIQALEAYNKRIEQLRAQEQDPRSAAQLENVGKLLKLMQQSIAKERKKEEADEEPPPQEEEETPPPPEKPLPEPKPDLPEEPILPEPPPETPIPVPDPEPQPEPETPEPTPREPTLAEKALLEAAPRWFRELSLISAVGYESNILHSAINELESATLMVDLSAQAINTRRHDQRIMAIGRYSRIHFLDESDIRDEDLLFLFGQYEHRLNSTLWGGASIDYLQAHLPVDKLDFIDPDRSFAPIGINQWAVAAQIAWEPSEKHQVILRAGFRREEVDPLQGMDNNDADQVFLETAYHWSPSKTQRLSLHYEWRQRDYDDRELREINGMRIPRSESMLDIHQWRIAYRWHWEIGEAKARWIQGARLRLEDDNGPGYDDLLRFDLQTRFEWHYKRLEVATAWQWGLYEYDSRQVSSTDRRHRERRFWEASIEASYALTQRSRLWMRYHFRDSDGNRFTDRYEDHGIYAGLKFTF